MSLERSPPSLRSLVYLDMSDIGLLDVESLGFRVGFNVFEELEEVLAGLLWPSSYTIKRKTLPWVTWNGWAWAVRPAVAAYLRNGMHCLCSITSWRYFWAFSSGIPLRASAAS